jgi:hypothetical protein
MDTYKEKISLLSEMIAFAIVDEELHDREFDFLLLVSKELDIKKDTFMALFHKRNEFVIVKDEFSRILHFYRLSLLMHCDNILHNRENVAIHEIGIKMGLSPTAMNRILKLMEKTPNHMIAPEVLIEAFQTQYN